MKPQELAATFGIIGIPLVDARANFLIPAKFGDEIEIASRVAEFRRSSFDVEHRITIDGKLAVEGGETRVWAARSHGRSRAASAPPLFPPKSLPNLANSRRPRAKVPAIPGIGSGGRRPLVCRSLKAKTKRDSNSRR